MLRGFESDQIGVRRHLTCTSFKKQVHFPGELAWRRAKKCLTKGAHWKLRIKSTLTVEANLSGKDCAVMETPSRHKSSGVEVGGLPPKAKWIVHVVRTHGPPVRTEADYADVHALNSAMSVPRTARVWAILSGPRR